MSKSEAQASDGMYPAGQALTLFEEFKKFAFKGNVVDLAVGVIIGGAFAKIIDSMVKNLIMPLVAVVMPGDQGYANWVWVINDQPVPYGLFLAEIVNFLILAAVLFLSIVKFLGWLMKSKQADSGAKPIPPSTQEQLLMEIRDLLRAQSNPA